jgi:hypothetical protein
VLQDISFGSPSGPNDAHASNPESLAQPQAATPSPNEDAPLINMSRDASTKGMQEGVIPSSPSSSVAKLSKLLPCAVLSPVPRALHHAQARPAPVVPRHSSRLAKKARGRTMAVAAYQNVLMKKLGISQATQLQTADFEAYIKCFKEGLMREPTDMIRELFTEPPAPDARQRDVSAMKP